MRAPARPTGCSRPPRARCWRAPPRPTPSRAPGEAPRRAPPRSRMPACSPGRAASRGTPRRTAVQARVRWRSTAAGPLSDLRTRRPARPRGARLRHLGQGRGHPRMQGQGQGRSYSRLPARPAEAARLRTRPAGRPRQPRGGGAGWPGSAACVCATSASRRTSCSSAWVRLSGAAGCTCQLPHLPCAEDHATMLAALGAARVHKPVCPGCQSRVA